MISLLLILAVVGQMALAQDEPVITGSEDGLAIALSAAVDSIVALIRCGRQGCPSDRSASSDSEAFIEIIDAGVLGFGSLDDEDPAMRCTITSVCISMRRDMLLGQNTTTYRADIHGVSQTNGRRYLVDTLELVYIENEERAFERIEKLFPMGSETFCLPEIFRSKK